MSAAHGHDDFDFEPVRGLPKSLPSGESILWQGAPDAAVLARRVFHIRKLAFYFAALVTWSAATAFADGATLREAVFALGSAALLSVAGLGLVWLFAWASARSTVYTITQRRLVMRIGIALPITFNIPFKLVERAGVKLNPDGSGDIALTLVPGERMAYLVMWPHARPWQFVRVEPALRGIARVEDVAQVLARAVVGDQTASPHGTPVRGIVAKPAAAAVAPGGQLSGSAA